MGLSGVRISFSVREQGATLCPRTPGEPFPSVPPIETMGPPSATGAFGQPPAPNLVIPDSEMRADVGTRRGIEFIALTSDNRSGLG